MRAVAYGLIVALQVGLIMGGLHLFKAVAAHPGPSAPGIVAPGAPGAGGIPSSSLADRLTDFQRQLAAHQR